MRRPTSDRRAPSLHQESPSSPQGSDERPRLSSSEGVGWDSRQGAARPPTATFRRGDPDEDSNFVMLLQPWRLRRSRSLRRSTKAILKDSWTRESPYWRYRFQARHDGLPYLAVPGAFALVISIPIVAASWGKAVPTWLSGAWQVSGVLVGFGLALVLFLMEAVVSRNLRSPATFRAVIRQTRVEVPLALALVFLAVIGVLKYGADGSGAPMAGWCEAGLLIVFLAQLGSLMSVFTRSLALVPPGAIADVIRHSFRLVATRNAERRLTQRAGNNLLMAECEKTGRDEANEPFVTYGLFLKKGKSVKPARAGQIHDVDLSLPARIAALRPEHPVALNTPLIEGVKINDFAIGRYPATPPGWLRYELNRALTIRRQKEYPGVLEVFREATEYYRRALATGSTADLDQSTDVIVDAFTEAARAWKAFGLNYDRGNISSFIGLADDDDLYRELRDLATDVVSSHNALFIRSLGSLAYRLIMAGVREDAPLLIEQGMQLNDAQTFA